jgi:hypothetical protein
MSADIVGYAYRANLYCPRHIYGIVLRGATVEIGLLGAVEASLDALAVRLGIDRADESTFDSGTFPTVVLRSMLRDPHTCECGHNVEDHMPMDWDVRRGCPVVIGGHAENPVFCPCDEFDPGIPDRCASCGEELGS